MKKHDIAAEFVNIDQDPEAKQAVMAMNGGNASVPTILFPDGSMLVEPNYKQLRAKLGIKEESLTDRLKGILGG